MQLAYIGLGSNLAEPQRQIERAFEALAELPESAFRRASQRYRTPPWGDPAQPDFINAVAELETALAPVALLEALLRIERDFGRVRAGRRWGPRIIDLDLLWYAGQEINQPGLQLPHPHLHQRAFVLLPLRELAPTMRIAGHGTVDALCLGIDSSDCHVIAAAHGAGDRHS